MSKKTVLFCELSWMIPYQWSGDRPSWSKTSTRAPLSISVWTTSACPISHARKSGVSLAWSVALIAAPCCSNNCTLWAKPAKEAACRASSRMETEDYPSWQHIMNTTGAGYTLKFLGSKGASHIPSVKGGGERQIERFHQVITPYQTLVSAHQSSLCWVYVACQAPEILWYF